MTRKTRLAGWRLSGTSKVALAVAALLASLSLVSMRQRTALDTMAFLDSLQLEEAMQEAQQAIEQAIADMQ